MDKVEIILNKFYENSITNFSDIDFKKLIKLMQKAEKLNFFYTNQHLNLDIVRRYTKIMELIYTNQNRPEYGTNSLASYANTQSNSEKLLLYMLSIDPNLEALIIYESYNTIKEIKQNIKLKFGVYDPNLIKIEKHYLKRFASNFKREKINETIEKKIFK